MTKDLNTDMEPENDGYLDGHILIAMPTMSDPRFEKSIILLCAHGEDGAMGIVLNKNLDMLSFEDLLDQLDIEHEDYLGNLKVQFGGPVEAERGFLLHTTDQVHETSIMIDKDIALTATMDMLQSIAEGTGPENCLLALGYSGWGPGQLEREIQENGWLVVDADPELVFSKSVGSKWTNAIRKLGFDPGALSGEAGHA